MRKICVSLVSIGFVLFSCVGLRAQETSREFKRNAMHSTLGWGSYETLSVGIERALVLKERYEFSVIGTYSVTGSRSGSNNKIGALGLYSFGRRDHHLDLGLGIAVGKTGSYDRYETRYRQLIIYPALGYRFQKNEGVLVFRTGIDLLHGFYIGTGVRF